MDVLIPSFVEQADLRLTEHSVVEVDAEPFECSRDRDKDKIGHPRGQLRAWRRGAQPSHLTRTAISD